MLVLMKILIIGPLGAGKSTLAYQINKKFNLKRLNLDEVARNPQDGSYYSQKDQLKNLNQFLQVNDDWVIEGSQYPLYQQTNPDLIVDMRINRLIAIWRFTTRFIKAKKLQGKVIDKDLPVQAYHYRPVSLKKIMEWDKSNQEIMHDIAHFLDNITIQSIKCKKYADYQKVFDIIQKVVS